MVHYSTVLDITGPLAIKLYILLSSWTLTSSVIKGLLCGFRVGSRLDNWRLYRCALEEMARVVRPGTGRVCLLTQDKKCMIKVTPCYIKPTIKVL